MNLLKRIPLAIALSMLVSVTASRTAPAAEPHQQLFINPDQLKWDAAPPSLPKGAMVSVLSGDPHKPGPFVIRLMAPPNYTIPPHWHSKAESLTVISGMLYLGDGDQLDRAKAHALIPGGFHYLPARAHHYAFTKSATIVQIHGEGPFDIIYINPKDDPQKQRPK